MLAQDIELEVLLVHMFQCAERLPKSQVTSYAVQHGVAAAAAAAVLDDQQGIEVAMLRNVLISLTSILPRLSRADSRIEPLLLLFSIPSLLPKCKESHPGIPITILSQWNQKGIYLTALMPPL